MLGLLKLTSWLMLWTRLFVSALVAHISAMLSLSSILEESAGDGPPGGLMLAELMDARDPWIADAPGPESNDGGSLPFFITNNLVGMIVSGKILIICVMRISHLL